MKTLNAIAASAALAVTGAAFANGSIEGTISFTGTAPKVEKYKRTSDAFCAKSGKEMNDESIKLSKDGKALENVVVRITKGAPEAKSVPSTPIVVEQKECNYSPRVQAALAGSKIMIKNDDGTMHNVHSYEGTKTLFNQAQPPKSKPLEKEAPKNDDVVKFKCDVHNWMTGYVVLNKNPYFAVSDASGKFDIKDVPAGTYTVETWQEKLGTKTQQVTVADGKAAKLDVAYGK